MNSQRRYLELAFREGRGSSMATNSVLALQTHMLFQAVQDGKCFVLSNAIINTPHPL